MFKNKSNRYITRGVNGVINNLDSFVRWCRAGGKDYLVRKKSYLRVIRRIVS
ncbi:hypothetical protein SAMN02745196_00010 [Clostridium collagenovorans DSM 3089]|uniref:Uncharacterized protein n=1 Tax=Clostridium collagenovorans DSM 3089 TaxID=1121306 RepID=A0A1M5S3B3_9CLOT|nr:hypothetical protein SAMN02745196_00010 [Clostridium collagenovorans DSM 3089]